jgi:RNA polymerase sigma factor (sigma-70 family)
VTVTQTEIENATRMAQTVVQRRLASRLAARPAVAREDLDQEVRLAVWKCAPSFDPTRGVLFRTFALAQAYGACQHLLRSAHAFGNTGRRHREQVDAGQIEGGAADLSPLSLETTPCGTGRLCLGDVLADPREALEAGALRGAIWNSVERLEPRLGAVLLLRYGCGWTQRRTGKALGCSQMQVFRLERKALAQLREMLEGEA